MSAARDLGIKVAAWQHGLGATVGGLGSVALQLLLDKDLRDTVLDKGEGQVHPAVLRNAAKLAPLLNNLNPETARIGIGAVPGTGKTQLAVELAKRLGMKHHDADLSFGLAPISKGSVADQYSTLVNEDPEQFDALIHLRRPGATRGPGGDPFFKLKELDEASTRQFDEARGQLHEVAPGVRLKLRPPEGFGTKPLNQSFINKGYLAKKLAPGVAGAIAGAIAAQVIK